MKVPNTRAHNMFDFIFVLELFDNYMQQDAHEFLNYLLNTIGDILQGDFALTFCRFSYSHAITLLQYLASLALFY